MKRKISFILSIIILVLVYILTTTLVTDDESDLIEEVTETTVNDDIEIEETAEIKLDKTGTLDNITFIVDVTNIQNYNSYYVIIGNTATEKSYSGEIHIRSGSIDNIEINKTYKFIVEPLMSLSTPPVAIEVTREEASKDEILQMHEHRKLVSSYKECLLLYKNMELADIVNHSNNNYYTWTNDEITQFIEYITQLGYNEDLEIKSEVKIISTPE